MANCSHRRRDETRQFCMVSNCVHTTDKTVLSRLTHFRRIRVGGVNKPLQNLAGENVQSCAILTTMHVSNISVGRQETYRFSVELHDTVLCSGSPDLPTTAQHECMRRARENYCKGRLSIYSLTQKRPPLSRDVVEW